MDSSSRIDQKEPPKFKFIDVKLPVLQSTLGSLDFPARDYKYFVAHGVKATIISDKELHVLFGAKVYSEDTLDINGKDIPIDIVLAEAVGVFKFQEKIPMVQKINDIPLIANLLALIYPFLRERISSCFHINKIQFLLDPVNIFLMLEGFSNQNSALVIDKRN